MIVSPKLVVPAVLVLLASALAWTLAPDVAPTKSVSANVEAWEVPKTQPREPAKWGESILKHKLWGGDGSVSVKGPNAAASRESLWSIAGVVIEGKDVFVLISIDGQDSKPFRVGDTLPDGSTITKIEEYRLHFSHNGMESALDIFRK